MPNLPTILLLLSAALPLYASSPANATASVPCVSQVPQTTVDADLTITTWDQSGCKGPIKASYLFAYEQNTYQNTSFKSYNLSRALRSNEMIDFSRPPLEGETTEECQRQCGIQNGTLTLATAKDVSNNGTCYEAFDDASCFRLSTFDVTSNISATSPAGKSSDSSTMSTKTSTFSSTSEASHKTTTLVTSVAGSAHNQTTASTSKVSVSSTQRASLTPSTNISPVSSERAINSTTSIDVAPSASRKSTASSVTRTSDSSDLISSETVSKASTSEPSSSTTSVSSTSLSSTVSISKSSTPTSSSATSVSIPPPLFTVVSSVSSSTSSVSIPAPLFSVVSSSAGTSASLEPTSSKS